MNESPDEAEIVEVYSAANSMEAHFLKNLLEEAGINARVVGDDLLAGAGELPLGKPIAPRIWVLEADALRARQLMKDYEAAHARPHSDEDAPEETWTCPSCGEKVEADFDLCWNCQTPRSPY